MPDTPPWTKFPSMSVPPVPRTSLQFPAVPPTPALQISRSGSGMLGAPWPNTRKVPATVPPVITGETGVGVLVGVRVFVAVGVPV